jgi:hypothetical protein
MELEGLKQSGKTQPETTEQKEIIKDYVEYENLGGSAVVESDLGKLEEIATRLESGEENLTGWQEAMMPMWMREQFSGDSVDAQQVVEQVIQKNLRAILGGQFAQQEAAELIKRAYNPNLDEAANAKRLRSAIEEIRGMKDARDKLYSTIGKGPLAEQGGATVVETRTLADGRKIELLSDGTKRLAK